MRMLQITIPSAELWNEKEECFISTKEQTLQLEHSLVSISKWEAKHCKAFLSNKKITSDELLDYVRCMTLTQNVKQETYLYLTQKNMEDIKQYIDAPMTATYFSKQKNAQSKEVITSELIYYWMIAFNIPFECQKWHLNRLMTLINVCSIKNKPPKKMSKREIMANNARLNSARRHAMNTRG